MAKFFLLIVAALVALACADFLTSTQITEYKEAVLRIKHAFEGQYKHEAYNRTAFMCDSIGPRLLGSDNLNKAIVWLQDQFTKDNFDNVRSEPVANCAHWVRGKESLEMISPRGAVLPVTALGYSVGTPSQGITAEAIVVNSFDELEQKKDQIRGKIVVYNQPWTSYGESVAYRSRGAARASKYGAVASLTRSVTPFSIASLHTGMMSYDSNYTKIPAAAITVEDATMLRRFYERGQKIVLSLKLGCQNLEPITSYNVVGQITGTTYPNEIIVIGGHLDSWDLAYGAMDDAAGVMVCYQAVRVLLGLGLRPKRTIRVVAFTGEELGVFGGAAYAKAHQSEINNTILAFESDLGTFKPLGLQFTGGDRGFRLVEDIATNLLDVLNTTIVERGGGGADIGDLMRQGVPGMSPKNANEHYFWYHHSSGDTMLVQDPNDMDGNAAMIAAFTYVVADMDQRFPRD